MSLQFSFSFSLGNRLRMNCSSMSGQSATATSQQRIQSGSAEELKTLISSLDLLQGLQFLRRAFFCHLLVVRAQSLSKFSLQLLIIFFRFHLVYRLWLIIPLYLLR